MTVADAKDFLKSLEGQWKSVADGPTKMFGASKNVAVGEYWLALHHCNITICDLLARRVPRGCSFVLKNQPGGRFELARHSNHRIG